MCTVSWLSPIKFSYTLVERYFYNLPDNNLEVSKLE